MRPLPRPAFSFQDDPAIPAFDRSRIVLVMDGACGLCSAAARFIARHDPGDRIRITTTSRDLGRALLQHYALDPDDPQSWLMIENGQAFGALEAVLRLAPRLHWGFALLGTLGVLPASMQDWLYARIARNRYALFGRTELCELPDAELQKRLI